MARKSGEIGMKAPEWLPPLIELPDYDGDWQKYFDAIYESFVADFVKHVPCFDGLPVRLKRHPVQKGKEATFWHLISEGKTEEERTPDIRRCERIRWPKQVIENAKDQAIKVWGNKRKGERRICLWLEDCDYLVVLAERNGFYLIWTAYLIKSVHQKRKLKAEYEKAHKC